MFNETNSQKFHLRTFLNEADLWIDPLYQHRKIGQRNVANTDATNSVYFCFRFGFPTFVLFFFVFLPFLGALVQV
jgi:hypothetical protein